MTPTDTEEGGEARAEAKDADVWAAWIDADYERRHNVAWTLQKYICSNAPFRFSCAHLAREGGRTLCGRMPGIEQGPSDNGSRCRQCLRVAKRELQTVPERKDSPHAR